MKTIEKTIRVPQLVIKYDTGTDSPREWSNLGYFLTIENNYESPDVITQLLDIVQESSEQVSSTAEHMEHITKLINNSDFGEKVLAIYPINRYEHGGVVYSLGEKHGFDYSNCGFYIVTDKTAKELGIKAKDYEKVIKQELEVYNSYANGSVYRFYLYDQDGELEDSCGGFYELDDIKDHLPDEWKDENLNEYFEN